MLVVVYVFNAARLQGQKVRQVHEKCVCTAQQEYLLGCKSTARCLGPGVWHFSPNTPTNEETPSMLLQSARSTPLMLEDKQRAAVSSTELAAICLRLSLCRAITSSSS